MSFYSDAAATALRLIRSKGGLIPVARITKTFDGATNANTAVVAAKGEVNAVKLPLSTSDAKALDNRLLEALVAGKLRKLLIAASGAPFEPIATDIFTFDSTYWIARGCTPLKPADVALVYTVIVESTILSAEDIAALA